jgi:hypothetical protein
VRPDWFWHTLICENEIIKTTATVKTMMKFFIMRQRPSRGTTVTMITLLQAAYHLEALISVAPHAGSMERVTANI